MLDDVLDRAKPGSERGRVAELMVAAHLTSRGWRVSFSPSDASYDLLVEQSGRMLRVQVKTAYQRGSRGYNVFNTASGTAKSRHNYEDQAFDYFAVVVAGEGIFYVPQNAEWRHSKRVDDDMLTLTELQL